MTGRDDHEAAARRAAEFAARDRFGRLVGALARRFGPHGDAENALSEALASALVQWSRDGVPDNPGAWLISVAHRRLIDGARRGAVAARAADDLKVLADEVDEMEPPGFPDDRLKLMFVCTHPAIDRSAQVPLMLQTVLGLTAAEIGAAFLVAPNTMGQRLARTKNKIREAGIAFAVPDADLLPQRMGAVLDAIYACYVRGVGGTADPETAGALTEEALWLARIAHDLAPSDPEAGGLLALLEMLQARRPASLRDGAWVPLLDQDASSWDAVRIARAEALLREAWRVNAPGRFQIEAAIQSAHCDRRRTGETPWDAILSLHDALIALAPSVGARVSRVAVLIALGRWNEADGSLRAIKDSEPVAAYQPFWVTSAELAIRTGDAEQASRALSVAIGLTIDPAIRAYLFGRRAQIPT